MPVDLETALQQAPVETKPEKKEFIIDPVERTITVPNTLLGVFSDRNVKRLYFKCPRVVEDNIDLSKCQAFINYVSASGKLGQYLIKDIAVQNQDIIFSWLLSENLFDLNAEKDIWFAVQFKTSTGENVFNTTKAKGIIKETVDAGTYVEEQYADIILDLIAQVDDIKKNPVKPEQIEKAVQDYFSKHPVEGGATVEQLAQIEKNKQDIIKLSQKKIPVKISELTNDSDFKTGSQVDQKITAHDTNPLAHSDLREELKKLQQRIQTALNSDDVSLDQLSEIVAYIKSNKSLIDEITTNKVNVSDVINNLTTNNFKKPLSAAQGVVLKTLIDGIVIPEKLSQLQNDQNFQSDAEVKQTVDNAIKNIPSGQNNSGLKRMASVELDGATVQAEFTCNGETLIQVHLINTQCDKPATVRIELQFEGGITIGSYNINLNTSEFLPKTSVLIIGTTIHRALYAITGESAGYNALSPSFNLTQTMYEPSPYPEKKLINIKLMFSEPLKKGAEIILEGM